MTKVFNWFRVYLKPTAVFVTILMMGMGIMPTIHQGQAFVSAIQFEKMAAETPAYQFTKDIEAEIDVYVLDIDMWPENDMVVVWLMPGNLGDMDVGTFLHTVYAHLYQYYPDRSHYFIMIAEAAPIMGADGNVTVLVRGQAGYGMSQTAVLALLSSSDIDTTLDTLYNSGEFQFQAFMYGMTPPYLSSLLPRAADHIPPWETE